MLCRAEKLSSVFKTAKVWDARGCVQQSQTDQHYKENDFPEEKFSLCEIFPRVPSNSFSQNTVLFHIETAAIVKELCHKKVCGIN